MIAPSRLIADAVVARLLTWPDLLNLGILATPERSWIAYFMGEGLDATKLRVYPDGKGSDGDLDREGSITQYSVSVAVVQNVSSALADTDLLVDYVESLHDFLVHRDNRDYNTPDICFELAPPFEIDPILDQKELHENKLFVSRTFFNFEFVANHR